MGLCLRLQSALLRGRINRDCACVCVCVCVCPFFCIGVVSDVSSVLLLCCPLISLSFCLLLPVHCFVAPCFAFAFVCVCEVAVILFPFARFTTAHSATHCVMSHLSLLCCRPLTVCCANHVSSLPTPSLSWRRL